MGEAAIVRAAELGLPRSVQAVAWVIAERGSGCIAHVWTMLESIADQFGHLYHRSTLHRAVRKLLDHELVTSERIWSPEHKPDEARWFVAGMVVRRAQAALVGEWFDKVRDYTERWKKQREAKALKREERRRARKQRERELHEKWLAAEAEKRQKKAAREPRKYKPFVPDTNPIERLSMSETFQGIANVLGALATSAEPASVDVVERGPPSWEDRLLDAELDELDSDSE